MIDQPNQVWITTTKGLFRLVRVGHDWRSDGLLVTVSEDGKVRLEESQDPVFQIEVIWHQGVAEGSLVLGDDWERSYGTLGWALYDPHRAMPWYFAATKGDKTSCWGVMTGCNALAQWQAGSNSVHLVLDVRSGNRPIILRNRSIDLITVVRYQGDEPFSTLKSFLRQLSPNPRLAPQPVYGANDWYYAYGNNTAKGILDDSKRISDLSESRSSRPFSVIDDGWQPQNAQEGGSWDRGNSKFPDMPGLAHEIQVEGCRPGVWTRPLYSHEGHDPLWLMGKNSLDPSIPGVLEKVHADIHRLHQWGYQLIKHDYSTFDVTGMWGFDMTSGMASRGRTFSDQTRTTAEILLAFYRTIREAAGDSLIIGCNTVGHLCAGLFEIQRTGDDTSGREWARTVKMGVNTLAFRGVQEDAFFAADADCVGVTTDVPWEKTKLWLDLVARSGTPLFVSAQQKAVGADQVSALKRAFSIAAVKQPLAEPLDWMTTRTPHKWKLGGETVTFDW